jgi:hypothetical protein
LVCITMPLVCVNPHHDLVSINVLSLGRIDAFSLPVSFQLDLDLT